MTGTEDLLKEAKSALLNGAKYLEQINEEYKLHTNLWHHAVYVHVPIMLAVAKKIEEEAITQSDTQLNPDMPVQELRLHMGEMTAQEVRTARAAIRWANTRHNPVTQESKTDNEWQSIQTLPLRRKVEVKTVTGIVCVATAADRRYRVIHRGWVACFRRDKKCSGDVRALKWRELS